MEKISNDFLLYKIVAGYLSVYMYLVYSSKTCKHCLIFLFVFVHIYYTHSHTYTFIYIYIYMYIFIYVYIGVFKLHM